MSDDPKHTYPSEYGPENGGEIAQAWAILDTIKPGVIPDHIRAFLAGHIAAALMKDAMPMARADEWIARVLFNSVREPGRSLPTWDQSDNYVLKRRYIAIARCTICMCKEFINEKVK